MALTPPGTPRREPWFAGEEKRSASARGGPERCCIRQSRLQFSLFRESILRAYGLDAEVCYLGVNELRFTPGEDGTRQPFFLSMGHAAAHKNAAFIIRALGRRNDKSWPLVWAANIVDKGYAAMLNELAGDVGVTLDLRPKVSDQELLELLRTAGLFLYAPRLEPFGLAPLEASACGLVTVGAAEAGTRESIIEGQNGFLTAPDEASFAHKIDEALADKGRLQEMGRQAREIVEQKCVAPRTRSAFGEALGARGRTENARRPMHVVIREVR